MADEWNGGGVNATEDTILDYLTHPKGGNLSESRARELMAEYPRPVADGIRYASFANYVGDQLLRAAGLPEGSDE